MGDERQPVDRGGGYVGLAEGSSWQHPAGAGRQYWKPGDGFVVYRFRNGRHRSIDHQRPITKSRPACALAHRYRSNGDMGVVHAFDDQGIDRTGLPIPDGFFLQLFYDSGGLYSISGGSRCQTR